MRTFTAADDKVLIRTAKVAPDGVLSARVARVPLYRLAGLHVDQDSLVVRLVDKQVSRVAADTERGGPGIQHQVVHVFARAKVVDVQGAALVHGDQPALVTGERNVLGSVRLRPRVDALPKQVPLAQRFRLVKGPRDKRLAVACPDTAADGLFKSLENLETLPGLQHTISIWLAGESARGSRRDTYICVPEFGIAIYATGHEQFAVRAPRKIAYFALGVPMQLLYQLALLDIPNVDRLLGPAASQPFTVGGEAELPDLLRLLRCLDSWAGELRHHLRREVTSVADMVCVEGKRLVACVVEALVYLASFQLV